MITRNFWRVVKQIRYKPFFNYLYWNGNGWSFYEQKTEGTSIKLASGKGAYSKDFIVRPSEANYIKINCGYFDTYNSKWKTPITIAYSSWQYLYTGEPSTIQKMISFDEGLFIQSDQPVLVRTIVTSEAFETAKDWDYVEWNARHRSVNEEKLDFTPENKGLQIYNYNLSEIPDGSTYVAAVHFADGTVKLGPVLRKK